MGAARIPVAAPPLRRDLCAPLVLGAGPADRGLPGVPGFAARVRTRVRGLLLAVAIVSTAPQVLRAQCPNGTPPPCGPPRPPAPKRVAVLYFGNLSRDSADQYLADGLTEEIMVRLGRVRRLDVASRFEVQRVRDA